MSVQNPEKPELKFDIAPYGEIVEKVRLRGMRGAIASSMTSSLRDSAQLTLHRTYDSAKLVEYRKQLDQGKQVSFNDLIMLVVAQLLPSHTILNSIIQDNEIYRWRSVNLGMAVSVENGLVVPVVRNANTLSLSGLSEETSRLSGRAQNGQISMSDLAGATFTVSNLGAYGVDGFTPIINPPQVAILGIGRLNASSSFLSLTIDHRAVDGAPGAAFLKDLAEALEDPIESLRY